MSNKDLIPTAGKANMRFSVHAWYQMHRPSTYKTKYLLLHQNIIADVTKLWNTFSDSFKHARTKHIIQNIFSSLVFLFPDECRCHGNLLTGCPYRMYLQLIRKV